MASRIQLLPRNENDRLLTPPLTCAPGRFFLIHPVARMKSAAYASCSSIPVAMASTLGSKMMSRGFIPTSCVSIR